MDPKSLYGAGQLSLKNSDLTHGASWHIKASFAYSCCRRRSEVGFLKRNAARTCVLMQQTSGPPSFEAAYEPNSWVQTRHAGLNGTRRCLMFFSASFTELSDWNAVRAHCTKRLLCSHVDQNSSHPHYHRRCSCPGAIHRQGYGLFILLINVSGMSVSSGRQHFNVTSLSIQIHMNLYQNLVLKRCTCAS